MSAYQGNTEILLYLSPHQASWNGLSPSALTTFWVAASGFELPAPQTRHETTTVPSVFDTSKGGHKHHSYVFRRVIIRRVKKLSQSNRGSQKGSGSKGSSCSNTLPWQGQAPPDQGAQSPIQAGLKYSQGWSIHELETLAKLCQCLTFLPGKRFFPQEQVNCDTGGTFPEGPNTAGGSPESSAQLHKQSQNQLGRKKTLKIIESNL